MNHIMFKQIADLDHLDHVALPVENVDRAVTWYQDHFRCEQIYKDESWAMLGFANTRISLVRSDQHPAHLGFVHSQAEEYGPLVEAPGRDPLGLRAGQRGQCGGAAG